MKYKSKDLGENEMKFSSVVNFCKYFHDKVVSIGMKNILKFLTGSDYINVNRFPSKDNY